MELDIEKFISSAHTNNRTVLDSFVGNRVSHSTFGNGQIVQADLRELEDGPIFRVQFGDSIKEFNLDSFREGYIRRIDISEERHQDDNTPAEPVAGRAA